MTRVAAALAATPMLLDVLRSLGWVHEEGFIKLPLARVPTCEVHVAGIRAARQWLLDGSDLRGGRTEHDAIPDATQQAVPPDQALHLDRFPHCTASLGCSLGWSLRLQLDPEGCLPEEFLEPCFHPLC